MPHDRKNYNKMQCLILTPISRSARVLQDPLPRAGCTLWSSPMSLNRRSFLNQSAAALAGTALSYSRIQGANERISLGHIGIGSRGSELAWIVSQLKDK